jgi:hypothetical protein
MSEELKQFLKNEYNTISINYSDFEVANLSSFDNLQEGYRLNSKSKESFIGTEPGDWKDQWFVIGYLAGDPVFVDISDNSVNTSQHSNGSWDQEKICESLDDFKQLLDQLKTIAIGRENPIKFGKNPINKKDVALYMSIISRKNAEQLFWMRFIQ